MEDVIEICDLTKAFIHIQGVFNVERNDKTLSTLSHPRPGRGEIHGPPQKRSDVNKYIRAGFPKFGGVCDVVRCDSFLSLMYTSWALLLTLKKPLRSSPLFASL